MELMFYRKPSNSNALLFFAAADFLNEFAQPPVIFFPGLQFYTAGDVNTVRTNDADRGGHVFNLQAACQNNTVVLRGAPGNIPIRGAARTTILARGSGVKQEGKSVPVFV